jgi:predicted nucleic acid-binding protein
MHSIVIADTSCFILLTKIDEIHLLRSIYKEVYTTPQIAFEFRDQLPEWIIVQDVADKERLNSLQSELDPGEASAIALSYELPDPILILDDWGARKVAARLRIAFTGTFGVLVKAKKDGVIKSIKPLIEKIKQTNFRVSEDVLAEILNEAGER